MKKINFKKVVASVAALTMIGAVAAMPASAASTGVTLAIDQVELTLDELKAQNYQVPVYINLTDNVGISAVEYGVEVDSRITDYTLVKNSTVAKRLGVAAPDLGMTSSTEGAFSWLGFASDVMVTGELSMICVYVTIPQDAAPGDQYDISYKAVSLKGDKNQIWENRAKEDDMGNAVSSANYVTAGTVDTTDGWVRIKDETPTTTTTAATTTTTAATTTTTAATTTTTAATTTTTAATTTTTAATTTTTAATTTTTGGSTTTGTGTTTTGTGTTTTGKATTTTAKTTATTKATTKAPTGGSPKTGSGDVMPIAATAAAVAVLGGVALVAKKKND